MGNRARGIRTGVAPLPKVAIALALAWSPALAQPAPDYFAPAPGLNPLDNNLRQLAHVGYFNWFCGAVAEQAGPAFAERADLHRRIAAPAAHIWVDRWARNMLQEPILRAMAPAVQAATAASPPANIPPLSLEWRHGVLWAYARLHALREVEARSAGRAASAAAALAYDDYSCQRWSDLGREVVSHFSNI